MSEPDMRTRDGRAQLDLPARDEVVLATLERTLAYARSREYTGWDYADGLSSRLLRAVPFENRWLNLAVQETVKRAPVNVRPLFGVEQRRNYMGAALFAMANQTAARLGLGGDVDYRAEATSLLDWLVEERYQGYDGYCGGHRHQLQYLHAERAVAVPDIVSTAHAVKALLRGGEFDESYPRLARRAVDFVLGHLDYRPAPSGTGAVVDYHPEEPSTYYTINAGALCARLFVDLYARFEEPALRERATALLDHVATLQTDVGGWTYRDPPERSHLSMDTHHNGFIIECFQRYHAVTGTDRYAETERAALEFFARELFAADGAPNFDESNSYPRDIHASTQGVLVFTYAGEFAVARRVLQWVFDNLGAGDGGFYYRKERFYTRRVTLMRWCQAWMAYAMAEYLDRRTV